ncbi:MAG: sulfotransferase [Candidatus Nitrospinota bacterium M3_3B_026]
MRGRFALDARRPPVIILGMHRSGTSMLAGLLKELGVSMGWSKRHNESVLFQRLNIAVERALNAGWDSPESYRWLSVCHGKKDELLAWLKKRVEGARGGLYFGRLGPLAFKRVSSIDGPWGWKDPRNTFTFDLWREIFPGAKVIHIMRNGVDVAASLRKRETENPPRLFSVYSSFRACSLEGGFSLWKAYVERARSIVPDGGEKDILHLRYEDFLSAPAGRLGEILDFIGASAPRGAIERAVSEVDTSRLYPFLGDGELRAFYESVRNDPLMKDLGYGEIG